MLWVSGQLPGLNELVNAKAAYGKKVPRGVVYNQLKKGCEERVVLSARSQRFEPKGKHFNYLFVEPNKKRDPSNISAGAVKMVEDGLQKAGVLDNDGWKQVEADTRYYHCEDGVEPGVFLVVQDCPVLSKGAMITKLQGYLSKGMVNR